MPLADVDFIDGNLLEFVQLWFAKPTLQVLGLDLLDGVPADLEMVGYVLDGHVLGEFQSIAFEGMGVVFLGAAKLISTWRSRRSRSSRRVAP